MRSGRAILFILLIVTSLPLAAESIVDEYTDHVVREGETLHDITALYLGVNFLWPENWKLNPQIDDPHLLQPGQVLRVIKSRLIEADRAAVSTVSNRAEKKLREADWSPASAGDLLSAEEGIRTFRNSSAELAFNERSMVRLDELSQIFLRAKETDLRGQDRGEVEVIRGAAEVAFTPMPRDLTEIEIVSGAARATTETDIGGNARVRLQQADGTAAVMVYEGRSQVSGGDTEIAVAKGEGVTVAADGELSEPETLLPRPQLLEPAAQEALAYVNAPLRWESVNEASHYLVEVCADGDCNELIAMASSDTLQTRYDSLPTGTLYWRVAAVSESGLRGYPSATRELSLATQRVDDQPPAVALQPLGFVREDASGRIWFAPTTQLRVLADDELAGLDQVAYRFGDSGNWIPYSGGVLSLPTANGPQQLQVRASDRAGNTGQTDFSWQSAD